MAKSVISQVAEEDADHNAQAKEDSAECTRHMHVQQREEDARVGLLIDVQLPAWMQSKHLGFLLRHSWFCWCSAHDVFLRPIVGETKSKEWPHPHSVR
jgi:hypothetical protein